MKKVLIGNYHEDITYKMDVDKIIPLLKVDYINPNQDEVDDDENINKKAYYHLYIVSPRMKHFFDIAEAIDYSNKNPKGTIFCFIDKGREIDQRFVRMRELINYGNENSPLVNDNTWYQEDEIKYLESVQKTIKDNGGRIFLTLEDAAKFLNKKKLIRDYFSLSFYLKKLINKLSFIKKYLPNKKDKQVDVQTENVDTLERISKDMKESEEKLCDNFFNLCMLKHPGLTPKDSIIIDKEMKNFKKTLKYKPLEDESSEKKISVLEVVNKINK
jgi:hypothetical protein